MVIVHEPKHDKSGKSHFRCPPLTTELEMDRRTLVATDDLLTARKHIESSRERRTVGSHRLA